MTRGEMIRFPDQGGNVPRPPLRMLTAEQKLRILQEVEATVASFRMRLDQVLDEMGIDRGVFMQWRAMRKDLERCVRRESGLAGAGQPGTDGDAREVLTQKLDEVSQFSQRDREDILAEIQRSIGGDEELLPLALQEMGLSRAVYEVWCHDQREQGYAKQLKPTPPREVPPPPEVPTPYTAMEFARRHLKELRCRLAVPSQPEQRMRIMACIQADNQIRRFKWQRSLGIADKGRSELIFNAWLSTRQRDASLLRRDWQVALNEQDSSFKAIPNVEAVIGQGLRPEQVLSPDAVRELFSFIEAELGRRLQERGLPAGAFNDWMLRPETSISISVTNALQGAKPISVRSESTGLTSQRLLTEQEISTLLRDLRQWVHEVLESHFLDATNYRNWVRYRARMQQREGVQTGEPVQADAEPTPEERSGRRRWGQYAGAWDLWPAFSKDKGNIDLRNRLVEIYLPLVKYNAKRIWARLPEGVELDDLISAGVFGLMDAVDAFDITRSVRFETYCVPRIRGAMLDELRTMDWVPRLVRSKASKLKEAVSALETQLKRQPSEQELADYLHVSVDELWRMAADADAVHFISLNKKWYETDSFKDVREIDILVDERAEQPDDLVEDEEFLEVAMEYAMRGFPPDIRQIFRLYHIEKYTMKEIGSAAGLCESRISQLHTDYFPRFEERLVKRAQRKDGRFPLEMLDVPEKRSSARNLLTPALTTSVSSRATASPARRRVLPEESPLPPIAVPEAACR